MKIAAVVVTYNRLALLKEVIEAFEEQKRLPDYLIVVNNASTDGTKEYLDKWADTKFSGGEKIVIHSSKNLGGSGGFYLGTERAMQTDADWVWVSDDDAVPNLDVFEKAEKHIEELNEPQKISAICAQVQTDGKIDLTHRKNIKTLFCRMYQEPVNENEYKNKEFECNSVSYVGMIMKNSVLKKVGLIDRDFFIWQDDLEHSIRIGKEGKIICYPDMIVDHRVNKLDYIEITWKTYYGYRNDLTVLKRYYSKRYFVFKAFRMIQKSICSFDMTHLKIAIAAIKGAKKEEKGLNNVYNPDWKR